MATDDRSAIQIHLSSPTDHPKAKEVREKREGGERKRESGRGSSRQPLIVRLTLHFCLTIVPCITHTYVMGW